MLTLAVAKKIIRQNPPLRGATGLLINQTIHEPVFNPLMSSPESKSDSSTDFLKRIEHAFADGKDERIPEIPVELLKEPKERVKSKKTNRKSKGNKKESVKNAEPINKTNEYACITVERTEKETVKPKTTKQEKLENFSKSLPECFEIEPILEDDNGPFRCAAKHLFNDQNSHHSIRQKSVAFMRKNIESFKNLINDSPDSYLEKMNIANAKCDSVIIKCIALAYKINLYILKEKSNKLKTIYVSPKHKNDLYMFQTATYNFHLLRKVTEDIDITVLPMESFSIIKNKPPLVTEIPQSEEDSDDYQEVLPKRRNKAFSKNKTEPPVKRETSPPEFKPVHSHSHERSTRPKKPIINKASRNTSPKETKSTTVPPTPVAIIEPTPAEPQQINHTTSSKEVENLSEIVSNVTIATTATETKVSPKKSDQAIEIKPLVEDAPKSPPTDTNETKKPEAKRVVTVQTVVSTDPTTTRKDGCTFPNESPNRSSGHHHEKSNRRRFKNNQNFNQYQNDGHGHYNNYDPNYNQHMHQMNAQHMYYYPQPVPYYQPHPVYFPDPYAQQYYEGYYGHSQQPFPATFYDQSFYQDCHPQDVAQPIPLPSEVSFQQRYIIPESMTDRLAMYRPPHLKNPPPIPPPSNEAEEPPKVYRYTDSALNNPPKLSSPSAKDAPKTE